MTIRNVVVMPIMALCGLLFGCAAFTGHPERSENLKGELKQIEHLLKPGIISKYDAIDKKTVDNNEKADEKRRMRNNIVNARIRAMNLHFNTFQKRLYQEGIGLNTTSDFAVVGLGAAGSIVSHLDTIQVLSAISGGLTGVKASFNKNAFFDQTMPALLSMMVAKRKETLVKIRTGLTKEIDEYPLMQALIDLEDYFVAGTLPGVIIGITEKAGEASSEAEDKLGEIVFSRTAEFVEEDRQERVEKLVKAVATLPDGVAIALNEDPPYSDSKIENAVKARLENYDVQ